MPSVLIETGRQLSTLLEMQDDTADRRELVAEIHDFLAMLDGIKPVFLHGRGLAPPDWVEQVLSIARELGLRVIEGPFWDATAYEVFQNGMLVIAGQSSSAIAPGIFARTKLSRSL